MNIGVHALIHTAHLIVLQLRHGINMYEAYKNAIVDVYVRSHTQISVQMVNTCIYHHLF